METAATGAWGENNARIAWVGPVGPNVRWRFEPSAQNHNKYRRSLAPSPASADAKVAYRVNRASLNIRHGLDSIPPGTRLAA
jgi:hypothetical protein